MGSAGGERADICRVFYRRDVMGWPGLLFPLILAETLDGGDLPVDWDRRYLLGAHRRLCVLGVWREPGTALGGAGAYRPPHAGPWLPPRALFAGHCGVPASGPLRW